MDGSRSRLRVFGDSQRRRTQSPGYRLFVGNVALDCLIALRGIYIPNRSPVPSDWARQYFKELDQTKRSILAAAYWQFSTTPGASPTEEFCAFATDQSLDDGYFAGMRSTYCQIYQQGPPDEEEDSGLSFADVSVEWVKTTWQSLRDDIAIGDSGLKYQNKVELDPNISTGPWEIIRFSVKDTNRHLEMIDMDKELREFTVYQIPYLRRHKHKTFELVVMKSCILELQEALGQRYNIERPDDLTLPDSGEVNVYGLQTAKEMGNRRFLSNAVDAVSNGWGEGPEWCYRDAAKSSGLEARLEMEVQNKSRSRSMGKSAKENNNGYVTLKDRI